MEEHLTPEEVVGLVEGTLESARAAHADVCARCRDEVAELRHIVTEATHETVPEPSPLFWRHQRERVAAEIGVGRRTSATGWHWWGPSRVVAAAAVALLVVGVVVGLSVSERSRGDKAVRTGIGDDPLLVDRRDAGSPDEAAWALLLNVVDGVDWEDGEMERWLVDLDTVEGAVAQLSAAERQDLVRLLEAELEGGTS